ncbi:SWIM zinc finger family protein [Nonomuraea roseola]|uniref:SWIM zinc finger family protein n=1 Tax=Nonomuraea roseola TaxID=46179 RepID=A0ABV5PVE8_9ACTN
MIERWSASAPDAVSRAAGPSGATVSSAGVAALGVTGSKDVRGGARGGAGRRARVEAGLAELERWLADQVRKGLAAASESEWQHLARRLVDAQAPGVAAMVGGLAEARSAADWPERLLAQIAMLHLLAAGHRGLDELPDELAQTVRTRVGYLITREKVLAGPAVRDLWHVLGRREETHDRLVARRVWLLGRRTGRAALVLSFAPVGQPLDDSLVTGELLDASLAFYPGASPLRALVAARHDEPSAVTGIEQLQGPEQGRRADAPVPPGGSASVALDTVAKALAGDPWTDSWPLVLAGALPTAGSLAGLPLHPGVATPWRLIALSGGRPLTVAAEWTPRGLVPLTAWDEHGLAVIL